MKREEGLLSLSRVRAGVKTLSVAVAAYPIIVGVLVGTSQARDDGSASASDDSNYVQIERPTDSLRTANPRGKSSARVALRARVSGLISESYDNNILDYSESDRLLFKAVPTNPRFGVSRLDDHITDARLRLAFESGTRRTSQWLLRLKGDATFFSSNRFRNYTQWGVEVRRTVRRVYAEFEFAWLPSYNLRNLYWRPMVGRPIGVKYAPADFGHLTYGLETGAALSRRLEARVNFGLGLSNYHFPFDERDNRTWMEMARLTYAISRRVVVSGGLGLAQSRAAGRDSTNAIVKDVSYNATLVEIGARVKCDPRGRVVATASIDYQHQAYRSAKPLDVSHYHRVDRDYDYTASLSWRVTEYLQPELNYEYRKSQSSVVPAATDFGSYTAGRVGVRITSYF